MKTINILLTIPSELNAKLCADAEKEKRSRQAHIVYLLEKYFESLSEKPLEKKAKRKTNGTEVL